MPLKQDLEIEIATLFRATWSERQGYVVPDPINLKLSNDGVHIDATVLYADLSDSTILVDTKSKTFSAEVYKAFLICAARIIASEGGAITAYDGDRIMAVFIGEDKESTAARVGLKINWACNNIVQPNLKAVYTKSDFVLKHVVGIDTSELLVAKAGFRGANDLVWIGRAANYAAKLCGESHEYPTWITKAVYDKLSVSSKYHQGTDMWKPWQWSKMNNAPIYSSTYWWSL